MLHTESVVTVLQRLSLQRYAQLLFLHVQALKLILAPVAAGHCSYIELDLYHVTSKCGSPSPLNTEVSVSFPVRDQRPARKLPEAASMSGSIKQYQASSVRASRRRSKSDPPSICEQPLLAGLSRSMQSLSASAQLPTDS